MVEISQEDAVKRFSHLMEPYSAKAVNPHSIINAFTAFYRDFRITGTTLEEDGDMLLLEWGATNPNLVSYFTDFRLLSDEELKFDSRKFQWVGLTRQIFASVVEETEFDDNAIGLTADIYFKEASGGEPSSNLWVSSPDELSNKLEEFFQNPYVEVLLDMEPTLVRISVGHVG